MIRTLTLEEARQVFADGRLGRLGCLSDGEPYVVPINYYADDDFAYVHSLPGKKIAALRAQPRACLLVEEIRDRTHWKSVLAYGNYEEVTEPSEKLRALNCFGEYFPFFTPVEASELSPGEPTEVIIFRLHLDRFEGVEEV